MMGAVVGAFEVGKVPDYDRLTEQFGATPLTPELVARLERVTGRRAHRFLRRGIAMSHRFLRRGIAMSHRDLERILDLKEQGKPIYLYTGRGASSQSMHLGHLVPFELTRYLQEALDIPVVIQMTDDEKFLFKDNLTLEQIRAMSMENIQGYLGVPIQSCHHLCVSQHRLHPAPVSDCVSHSKALVRAPPVVHFRLQARRQLRQVRVPGRSSGSVCSGMLSCAIWSLAVARHHSGHLYCGGDRPGSLFSV